MALIMIKKFSLPVFLVLSATCFAQVMTPEKLWELGRLGSRGVSEDGKYLVYSVKTPDINANTFDTEVFAIEIASGEKAQTADPESILPNPKISPDGKYLLRHERVKVRDVLASDYYQDLDKSQAMIYDELHYRHWDTWELGTYNHVFLENLETGEVIDLMEGEPYHCPTVPFGGAEDYVWNSDGSAVIYVCKKKFGTEYVNSTNTDLYQYDVSTGQTTNLTSGNAGYDTHPRFSEEGRLAYLSMKRDGYESDKNDLMVRYDDVSVNLTALWDGTVREFIWGEKGDEVFFTAATKGTIQLFRLSVPEESGGQALVEPITEGQHDFGDLVAQVGKEVIAGRTDMNHAREYYAVNVKNGKMRPLTDVNGSVYASLELPDIEKRTIKTTDGKDMVTWVIYPPDFDPSKKYPTLLYTQGGPQSPLSQFYSFRWNFQLMASQGYIVVAPNRRGMPGYGVEWNEQISGDWGGQNMRDYLSAIDALAEEPFVDKERLGCVGASFGGYSAFFLAGIHEGRFKTFIAHDGVFNLRSMYGTTEELFFVNWDLGGPYWEEENRSDYEAFNPINRVTDWDTPILIIQGGKDFRVPEGQAFEAFTAAQQLGLKSRMLYFPEENHWVLSPQNGLVWQREFFRWLDETLRADE
jgi:dipeptidyl aminopeptidase/acylaminoacyl peptidase